MKHWRLILGFTFWYIVCTSIAGVLEYVAFGGVTVNELTIEAANLLSFCVATSLVLTSKRIKQERITQIEIASVANIIAIWTFIFPMFGLLFTLSILAAVNNYSFIHNIVERWSIVSPIAILTMLFGGILDTMTVYFVAVNSLTRHFVQENQLRSKMYKT